MLFLVSNLKAIRQPSFPENEASILESAFINTANMSNLIFKSLSPRSCITTSSQRSWQTFQSLGRSSLPDSRPWASAHQPPPPPKPEIPTPVIIYSVTLKAWPLNRRACFLSSSIRCSACGDRACKEGLTALKSEQPLCHTEGCVLWDGNSIIHSFVRLLTE